MAASPRANFAQLFRGGAGYIPFTLDVGAIPGMTSPVLRRFQAATGESDPAEYFDYDFRLCSATAHFGGADASKFHDAFEPGTTFDEWGVGHWAGGGEGTYEQMFAPLAKAESIADIEALPTPVFDALPSPSPAEGFKRRGYTVFGYGGSIYEWSWWLRGMEQFMMDMIAEPTLAHAVIRKVGEYSTALALRSARAGIEVLCFYDDAGMQSGMQISPDLWRRYVKPAWAQLLQTVRKVCPGTRFFLHCCGEIDQIVPDIIELGFDILHPVQPECMDIGAVRRQWGQDIVLCATLSAQHTLPFGTPAEVRAEVQRLKALFDDDHRCILCPSNIIQPETPWENVVAFAEAARQR